MAAKSFVKDVEAAGRELRPPSVPINGDEKQKLPTDFADWLGSQLLTRLSQHRDWSAAGPIALGSWSRGELSPKSDIDLLFIGDEAAVSRVVQDFSREGLKLRYRMPEDRADWTVGVKPFDVLALIGAKPLASAATGDESSSDVDQLLEDQRAKLRDDWKNVRKKILRAMISERRGRNDRYDSITNYLEPNLKYGSGGLRDLEQALALRTLFPERFQSADDQHAFEVLTYYKSFFLLVRQKLHLSEGASDLLTAPEQAPIAKWLGFERPRDFMKEIQKGVSRVSFYADWAFEKVTSTKGRIADVDDRKLETPRDLFKALKDDPSVLMQNRVRNHADPVFASLGLRKQLGRNRELDLLIGRELTSFIDPSKEDAPLVALFRSRLIDHCVPEFRKIVGHVQHDQYHRFSVDAHILQAVRELGRLRKNPRKIAGRLAPRLEKLSKGDWDILSFACLYHDIAKGRDGDHSIEGIAIAEHDLKAFGKSPAFIRDVAWIVEEHLILSHAAFKENPASPKTWAKLAGKGLEKKRIGLMAAFTIVDIRATNPEAWTPWKERLLNEVVTNLENPESTPAIAFAKLAPEWVEKLDSFLVSMVPAAKLVEDLRSPTEKPRVLKTKGGQTWIRFSDRHDRPGLFAHYVGLLGAAGLGIRHASVHTFPEVGVYDWFEVKTVKPPEQIAKLLELAGSRSTLKRAPAPVRFDEITLASQSSEEWVISFRGKDQPGALLQAAKSLADLGADLRWARVHTWGRQIDDIFGVTPAQDAKAFLEKLRATLT